MVPTRQWSEAYGTYCKELVGPETYTTTQMAFFFSWHESYRTSMGWSRTTDEKGTTEERKRFVRVSNSSLEWNREASLEKASWLTSKPTKWSYSYERIFNWILVVMKKEIFSIRNFHFISWPDNFDTWKIWHILFFFNKKWTIWIVDLTLTNSILETLGYDMIKPSDLWLLSSWKNKRKKIFSLGGRIILAATVYR